MGSGRTLAPDVENIASKLIHAVPHRHILKSHSKIAMRPGSINRIGKGLLLLSCLTHAAVTCADIRVQAQPLEQLKIKITRSAPAQALSLRQSTVASQLTTTVSELPLKVGDMVVKNQLVARLDCIDNQLTLEQEKAELDVLSASKVLASKQLSRLNQLRKSNNASEEAINQKQSELNSVKARINSQNISINIARRQIEKCKITAPFSGVITEIHSEVGNFVTPGGKIISLTDTESIELETQLSHTELSQVAASPSLTFKYQNQVYPVTIRSTLTVVDASSQSRIVRLSFSDRTPLAGTVGRLRWSLPGDIVPDSLILERNGKRGLFIVDDSDTDRTARFIPVANANPGQPVAVDLPGDTLLVTEGRFALTDGTRIIVD